MPLQKIFCSEPVLGGEESMYVLLTDEGIKQEVKLVKQREVK